MIGRSFIDILWDVGIILVPLGPLDLALVLHRIGTGLKVVVCAEPR